MSKSLLANSKVYFEFDWHSEASIRGDTRRLL